MPSGAVPRDLLPGVVWDAAAESRWEALAADMVGRGLLPEDAEREARWAVEAELHRAFLKARVVEGVECKTPEAKRAMFKAWVSWYGEVRANRIADAIRHAGLCEKILKEW